MMFGDDCLDQSRLEGDPSADKVVQTIFSGERASEIMSALRAYNQNQSIPDSLPGYLQDFIKQHTALPPWADKKRMRSGSRFFVKHADLISAMLGLLSLPYDYAGSNGVQVLYLTNRLKNDTSRRLSETGKFLFDVMDPIAFEPSGSGFSSVMKVRLIHATIRFHLLRSGKWDMNRGLPINQEDQAGTNLSFSLIPIRGMRKIWTSISSEDYEDYLHLWNVISYLLGVKPDLLPSDGKEAYWLERSIRTRQFKKSTEGIVLTRSLVDAIEKDTGGDLSAERVAQYMWFLLGDEVANILELNKITDKPDLSTLADTLRRSPQLLSPRSVIQYKKMLSGVEVKFPEVE